MSKQGNYSYFVLFAESFCVIVLFWSLLNAVQLPHIAWEVPHSPKSDKKTAFLGNMKQNPFEPNKQLLQCFL